VLFVVSSDVFVRSVLDARSDIMFAVDARSDVTDVDARDARVVNALARPVVLPVSCAS